MTRLPFRVYNNGQQLVAVAFDNEAGDAILRKAIQLDTVGLESTGDLLPHDSHFKMAGKRDILRGGLLLEINYEKERISIAPISSTTRDPIESKTVEYTFSGMEVEDNRQSKIQKAKSKDKFHITRDVPLSDDTWP